MTVKVMCYFLKLYCNEASGAFKEVVDVLGVKLFVLFCSSLIRFSNLLLIVQSNSPTKLLSSISIPYRKTVFSTLTSAVGKLSIETKKFRIAAQFYRKIKKDYRCGCFKTFFPFKSTASARNKHRWSLYSCCECTSGTKQIIFFCSTITDSGHHIGTILVVPWNRAH